jgi:UTP-glucose-1-phosphate uridylyltransferase
MLGPINADLIQRMIKAMNEGNTSDVGATMVEYQKQFDKYLMPACPSQLTAPALHKMLSFSGTQGFVYGGKGIGSQGDGCAQFLAKSEEDQKKLIEIITKECNLPCLPLTLGATYTVRKAVVPVAGYQSDLFPANVTGTGMFPIVDHFDGLCKPAILILVEEAVCAGIEEVVVVVHPDDEQVYKRLFHSKMAIQKFNRLNPAGQKYYQRIQELGQKVTIVAQVKANGFGGAVLAAAEVIGTASPFLLLLGDHLYRSVSHESCSQQLIRQFTGAPIVGLRFTPEADVSHFGAANGRWDEKSGLLDITLFAEKPNTDYARLNLLPPPQPISTTSSTSATPAPAVTRTTSPSMQPKDKRAGEVSQFMYLTVFGMYILPPQVFNILEKEQVHLNQAGKTEVPLTPALDRLRQEQGFQGYVVKGERFDFGHPETYVNTLSRFSSHTMTL